MDLVESPLVQYAIDELARRDTRSSLIYCHSRGVRGGGRLLDHSPVLEHALAKGKYQSSLEILKRHPI